MQHISIGLTAQSGANVKLHELSTVAAALSIQLARDVAPVWKVSASVAAYQSVQSIPTGVWPVIVQNDIGDPNALGFHTDDNHQPYALIALNSDWTVTASHEVIEMVVDPFGSRMQHTKLNFPSLGIHELNALTLVEACDPCEMFAYSINGVSVSDFVLPDWYIGARQTHGDFMNKIAPVNIALDGYVSFINPTTGTPHWQQITNFGRLDLTDLGPTGAAFHQGSTLREAADAAARRHPYHPMRRKWVIAF